MRLRRPASSRSCTPSTSPMPAGDVPCTSMLRMGMSSGSTIPAASTSASIVIRGCTLPPRAAASTAAVSSFPGPPLRTTADAPATRPANALRSSTKVVWITTLRVSLRFMRFWASRKLSSPGRSTSSTVTSGRSRSVTSMASAIPTTTASPGSTAIPMTQACVIGGSSPMGGNRQSAPVGLRIDQAAPDGVTGQVDAVAQAELLEDVRAVALDRFLAQHQQRSNLPRGVAFRDQLRDLLLARRERVLPRRSAVVGVREEVLDQRRHGPGIQERLAAHRGAACLDQVLVRRGLEHVARGAGLQRLVEVLLVV